MSGQTLQNRPFLVAEDLSAIGTMSLGVAIPILAVFGVPTAILPTQVLSTQTEGFGTPAKLASSDWLNEAMAHWRNEQIQFSGALIGYVGQGKLLNQLTQALTSQSLNQLIVDPVMGDDGALYPGLSVAYVSAMRQLVTKADVITPNWTEAHLLLGKRMTDELPDQAALAAMLTDLKSICGQHTRIVITGIPAADAVLTAYSDQHQQRTISTVLRPGHFYGSGDVFSALLSAALMRNVNFKTAIELAVKGDAISLDQTSEVGNQRRYGMQLSQVLKWLALEVLPRLDSAK